MSLSHHANIVESIQFILGKMIINTVKYFMFGSLRNTQKLIHYFIVGHKSIVVSKEVVKKQGLATIPHEKPYPLVWAINDA